jgi:putative ABC transport system permease protein
LNILEVMRQTASSIAAHKLRSFLTMFGIMWGITSVILLVGLGKGFSRDQKEHLKTIGVDLAIIWGGRTSEQAGG